MSYARLRRPIAALLASLVVPAAHAADGVCHSFPEPAAQDEWPRLAPAVAHDAKLEARIEAMLATMSLEQKVGQMTQAEIQSITPEELRRFHVGSVLNGGGSWPGKRRDAKPADWLALADEYWQASMSVDAPTKIPVIWGIDAVHGHSNVRGATLFPHNIGLGAARDTCLLQRIGEATMRQVRATGQDWNFAPAVSVVRDDRWGRTYEGYSEHPAITQAYAAAMVRGMQGATGRSPLSGIVATAKHFIGDGGTERGVDQGVTRVSQAELIRLHAPGYFSALGAGVQSVMVSFSSIAAAGSSGPGQKMHGQKGLVTGVLKERLAFDGLVVSDWNGHAQVPGCSEESCAAAVNAGIDLFMVPQKWRQFIGNTIAQVKRGEVPMSRIDDAVRRILRVKLRAGLFEAPRPSQRAGAGSGDALLHRELAREAVQKSLVLLKNEKGLLPLSRGAKVLVVGRGADSLPMQAGGWSISWQGKDTTNADFPEGTTLLEGIRQAAGADKVTHSLMGRGVDVKAFDVVIAVIGETPYAEMEGDIKDTLAHAQRHDMDLALLDRVSGKGVPVVTVLLSGRPLYVNREINRSDAFVAAWLPGTEGQGVADLLFRGADGKANKDFTGRLSYSWPRTPCQTSVNLGDKDYKPLFPYGFGLGVADKAELPKLDEPPVPDTCS